MVAIPLTECSDGKNRFAGYPGLHSRFSEYRVWWTKVVKVARSPADTATMPTFRSLTIKRVASALAVAALLGAGVAPAAHAVKPPDASTDTTTKSDTRTKAPDDSTAGAGRKIR